MPIRSLSLSNARRAEQVLALQRASYRIEAELIGYDAIPPLIETLAVLQQCGEIFYGYWQGEELAGVISYKRDGQTLDIYRMMVHPAHFRQGIGRALLQFIEHVEQGIEQIIVSTGRDNAPARRLYLAAGFTMLNDEEVVPGLFITHFEKQLSA